MKSIIAKCIVVVMLVGLTSCVEYGNEIVLKEGGKCFYQPGVSESEANDVINSLTTQGYLDDTPKTIQIAREGDTVKLRFVVLPALRGLSSTHWWLEAVTQEVGESVFNGAPILAQVCDNHITPLLTVRSDYSKTARLGGKDHPVWVKMPLKDAQFDVISNALKGLPDSLVTQNTKFMLARKGPTVLLRISSTNAEEWTNDAIKSAQKISSGITQNSFGDSLAVDIHLCNELFQTDKIVFAKK